MAQDRSFKDYLILVENEQVGTKKRMASTSGLHPMLRTGWDTVDRLRGVLGSYRTVYNSTKGHTLVNYAGILGSLREGNLPSHYDGPKPPGIGRLREQLIGSNNGTNIILDLEILPSLIDNQSTIKLVLDSHSWNFDYGSVTAATIHLL